MRTWLFCSRYHGKSVRQERSQSAANNRWVHNPALVQLTGLPDYKGLVSMEILIPIVLPPLPPIILFYSKRHTVTNKLIAFCKHSRSIANTFRALSSVKWKHILDTLKPLKMQSSSLKGAELVSSLGLLGDYYQMNSCLFGPARSLYGMKAKRTSSDGRMARDGVAAESREGFSPTQRWSARHQGEDERATSTKR
jgi:hypothetical protein